MISVRFGPPPFDLRPFVRAAIDELGYFRSDRIDDLAGLLDRLWPSGISARMLIYNELEPMTEEEKSAEGAPRKSRMPRAVWNMLSEAGRADPVRAIEDTTTSIILAVQRERNERQRKQNPEIGVL